MRTIPEITVVMRPDYKIEHYIASPFVAVIVCNFDNENAVKHFSIRDDKELADIRALGYDNDLGIWKLKNMKHAN